MCKKEGHMRRLPTVGLVQRGAQLPEPDIFRMALRKEAPEIAIAAAASAAILQIVSTLM